MWQFKEGEYKQWLIEAQKRFESGTRPDLFERYDLPLDVAEEEDVEKALPILHGYWGKNKINPKFTALLSVLIADHRDARERLTNPDRRRAERAVAEAERGRRHGALLAGVQKTLSVIAGKGYITPQERDDLIAVHAARGLSDVDVRAAIAAVPVRAKAASDVRVKSLEEGLAKHIRDQIRVQLAVLQCRDVPEFLCIAPGSTSERWRQARQKREKEWRAKPANELKTAANGLLGLIKVHIEETPEHYEQARVWECAEAMRADVQLASGDKCISSAEHESLLKNGMALGLSADDAAAVISMLALECGATVETAAAGQNLSCTNCLTLLPLKDAPEDCPKCGHPLWRICPKCGTRMAGDTPACGRCHFVLANLPRAEKLKRRAERALEQGHIDEAEEAVDQAESLLDGSDPKTEELRRSILAWRKEADTLIAAVEKQFAEQALYALTGTLERLRDLSPAAVIRGSANAQQLLSDVRALTAQAEELVRLGLAHQAGNNFSAAATAYEDALRIARDFADARHCLDTCPPAAPPAVSARIDGDGIDLVWETGAKCTGISYQVMRLDGRPPATESEGVLVTTTEAGSCRDTSAPGGAHLFYSVFARRGNVVSSPACTRGLVYAAQAGNFAASGQDRTVTGSWTPAPPGARVRVIRKAGLAPAHPGDGQEITVQPGGFTDRNVENGKTYYYGVLVEYPTPGGEKVLSELRTVRVVPQTPPIPVKDLSLTPARGGLELTWTPPERGEVWIYRVASRPRETGAGALALPLPTEWGAPLDRQRPGQTFDPAPPLGLTYYMPVTISGETCLVGVPQRYAMAGDVSGLKADYEASGLKLSWAWPKSSTHALILWDTAAQPADPDASTTGKSRVDRRGSEPQGSLEIASPAPASYHFTAFAGYSASGQDVLSAALSRGCHADLFISADPYQIGYRFERGRGLFSGRRVILQLKALNRDVPALPGMVIVSRRGDVSPAHAGDGEVLERFGGGAGGLRFLPRGEECSLEFELREPRCTLAVHFQDSKQCQRFRLSRLSPAAAYFF